MCVCACIPSVYVCMCINGMDGCDCYHAATLTLAAVNIV